MKKFNALQFNTFFDLLGVDVSEYDLASFDDDKTYEYYGDIYEKIKCDLPSTSKRLSNVYEIIVSIINDDFDETSQESKDFTFGSVIDILNLINSINVVKPNSSNGIRYFNRTNILLADALMGLCTCGDLNHFYLKISNKSINDLFSDLKKEDDDPLRRLYYLIIFARLPIVDKSFIFKEDNNIDYDLLAKTIKQFSSLPSFYVLPVVDEEKRKKFVRKNYRQTIKDNIAGNPQE